MIRDKGVLVKRRRFLLRITTGCFPDVIWRQKQSHTWEGLQFFFIFLTEEQAKPQGHAQK